MDKLAARKIIQALAQRGAEVDRRLKTEPFTHFSVGKQLMAEGVVRAGALRIEPLKLIRRDMDASSVVA
jgi:hypothetical protein